MGAGEIIPSGALPFHPQRLGRQFLDGRNGDHQFPIQTICLLGKDSIIANG